jgi:hypothetical protein
MESKFVQAIEMYDGRHTIVPQLARNCLSLAMWVAAESNLSGSPERLNAKNDGRLFDAFAPTFGLSLRQFGWGLAACRHLPAD